MSGQMIGQSKCWQLLVMFPELQNYPKNMNPLVECEKFMQFRVFREIKKSWFWFYNSYIWELSIEILRSKSLQAAILTIRHNPGLSQETGSDVYVKSVPLLIWYYYRPQRSCGKLIFSEASVKNSVQGGGSASVHAGIHHNPWADPRPPPPWADTLPWQTPPGQTSPGRHPPGQTPFPHTDGYCNGQYASYWNAFLFCSYKYIALSHFVQGLQVNQEEVIIIKNNGAMSQKNSVVANSLNYQQFQRTRFNKTIFIIASDFKVRNIKFSKSVHPFIRGWSAVEYTEPLLDVRMMLMILLKREILHFKASIY